MQIFKKLNRNMVSIGSSMIKITCIMGLLFVGLSEILHAQQSASERSITINMSASEMLPADLIIFNVNINAEGKTPKEAYKLHKERESLLADLLQKLEIKEENIDYEPVRMNRRHINGNRYNNEKPEYITATNQSVSITFGDFAMYEEIQMALIENGFDSFNGQFSSSKIAEGKEKALVSAIKAARDRAELITQTSGVKLGEVSNISYSDHHIGVPRKSGNSMEMMSIARDASMMDFSQTVEVRASVNITYFIE